MDIVDMAIHLVVCQKSDLHRNSDLQTSEKLDPLQTTAKKSGQKIFWCKKLIHVALQN
jgi:hypothetical protein